MESSFADDLRHVLAADAGLGDVLVGELGAGAGDLVEHLGDEVLEIEDLHALVPQDLGEGVVLLLRDLQNGTSSNRSRSSSSGGRLRSSSPGRCRQTFLSLPISEGTCRPFVMASYLSFGPYWPNVSAPLRMGRCLLTALVISKTTCNSTSPPNGQQSAMNGISHMIPHDALRFSKSRFSKVNVLFLRN